MKMMLWENQISFVFRTKHNTNKSAKGHQQVSRMAIKLMVVVAIAGQWKKQRKELQNSEMEALTNGAEECAMLVCAYKENAFFGKYWII